MLGKAIVLFRRAHRLSQGDLAAHLGITKGHLSKIENGHQAPGKVIRKRITKVLGLSDAIMALANMTCPPEIQGVKNRRKFASLQRLAVEAIEKTPFPRETA